MSSPYTLCFVRKDILQNTEKFQIFIITSGIEKFLTETFILGYPYFNKSFITPKLQHYFLWRKRVFLSFIQNVCT